MFYISISFFFFSELSELFLFVYFSMGNLELDNLVQNYMLAFY